MWGGRGRRFLLTTDVGIARVAAVRMESSKFETAWSRSFEESIGVWGGIVEEIVDLKRRQSVLE
jgi:hypothetical protein